MESSLLKLVVNSFFGYSALNSTRFSKTRIISETYLTQHRKKLAGLASALQVTLLGAVPHAKPDKYPPSLMYATTWPRTDDRIENVSQVAGCILSNSRRVYLGRVLELLRAFHAGRVEPAYQDTDSWVLVHSRPLLSQCLKDNVGTAVLDKVMQSEEAEEEQSGRFKVENAGGTPYSAGFWKSGKVYSLSSSEEEVRRVRSIKRRAHELLRPEHYMQDPVTNRTSVRTMSLRATAALEIVLMQESHSLSHSLNPKRSFSVSMQRRQRQQQRCNESC